MKATLLAGLVGAVLTAACGDHVVYPPNTSGSLGGTPVSPAPPTATRHLIEFRVTGTALSARIVYATPVDGVTQAVSALPYVADVSTSATEMFLSLDVTPLTFAFASSPFLSGAIFVDNVLFRGSTAEDATTPLSVSGTWRAN